ncbi:MAG: sigma-70 family RNA polymerase sigma factor [Burkholderiales bacterium]|nr:sigma-70 family RNA polymerase sigma factor [Burkholderiales bacterium]
MNQSSNDAGAAAVVTASDITALLGRVQAGDRDAADIAFSALYPELRRIAHSRLRHGGDRVSLDTTALVHDSYLRFVQAKSLDVSCRGHFLAYASKVMRSVIVDMIREVNAERRGGGRFDLTLNTAIAEGAAADTGSEALHVHDALARLEAADPRMATVVEMRYFGGFSDPEIADALGVTVRTVGRDWEKARLFLHAMLSETGRPLAG